MAEIRNLSTANTVLDAITDIKGNKFVTFCYMKIYKLQTRRTRGVNQFMAERLQETLDWYKDKYGKTIAYKGLESFLNDEKMKEFPYTVIQVLRYNTQWTSQKDFNAKYTEYRRNEDIIRPKYGLKVRGHKESGLTVLDYGQTGVTVGSTENTQENLYLRMNMFNAKLLDSTLYLLDKEGNILEETTDDLFNSIQYIETNSDTNAIFKMHADKDLSIESVNKAEKVVQEYLNEINELKFKPKLYRVDRVLFITATSNGQKFFFKNDKLANAIDKVSVKASDIIKYADKYIEDNFELED